MAPSCPVKLPLPDTLSPIQVELSPDVRSYGLSLYPPTVPLPIATAVPGYADLTPYPIPAPPISPSPSPVNALFHVELFFGSFAGVLTDSFADDSVADDSLANCVAGFVTIYPVELTAHFKVF